MFTIIYHLYSTFDYNKKINVNDDFMDIDLVELNDKEISYISKNRHFSNKHKYCDICKSNTHNTDDCKYNGLKRRNRTNNNKNTTNNKNNNSNNKYTKS